MSHEPAAGVVIAEKYELEHLLGSGGMGAVWQAHHKVLDAKVAIKLLDPTLADDVGVQQRFMREAKASAALRSAHVVQVLDFGVDDTTPYMVLELLEGESLADRLQRTPKLSPKLTFDVINQICRAATRAHDAGIVHRDLKPANVFLVAEETLLVKVLDFGIAKMREADSAMLTTKEGTTLGTPYYMSPEQASASPDVDGRADLWALAVMTYECLLGERPLRTRVLAELVVQICAGSLPTPSSRGPVPPGFDAWFQRATSVAPAKRFTNAREFSAALGVALGISIAETAGEDPPLEVAVVLPRAIETDPTLDLSPTGDAASASKQQLELAPTALDGRAQTPSQTTGQMAAAELPTSESNKRNRLPRVLGLALLVAGIGVAAWRLSSQDDASAAVQPSVAIGAAVDSNAALDSATAVAPPDTLAPAASPSAHSLAEPNVQPTEVSGAASAKSSAKLAAPVAKPAAKPATKPTVAAPTDTAPFDPLEKRR